MPLVQSTFVSGRNPLSSSALIRTHGVPGKSEVGTDFWQSWDVPYTQNPGCNSPYCYIDVYFEPGWVRRSSFLDGRVKVAEQSLHGLLSHGEMASPRARARAVVSQIQRFCSSHNWFRKPARPPQKDSATLRKWVMPYPVHASNDRVLSPIPETNVHFGQRALKEKNMS